MKFSYFFIFLFCFVTIPSQAQIKTQYFDGPYIFHHGDSLRIQWVERGVGHDSLIAKSDATLFQRDSLPVVNLQDLDFEVEKKSKFKGVDKLIAISDVHGQFHILIQLLQAHQVIDDNKKWNFGEGQLVIVGDNLDRGPQAIEILWFLFYLQKEASLAGGKVHVLLGNHEQMVLSGDIRYLNKKYYYTSGALRTQYHKLFREGSVLGDWIASHKVITTINKCMFLHGGLSPEVLNMGYSPDDINNAFTEKIIRKSDQSIEKDSLVSFLNSQVGPLWYRGYFDTLSMNKKIVKAIQKKLKLKTIIVGHTSLKKITSMFDGKIIAIDCSIKLGKTGQLLIYEEGEFFVGEMNGERKYLTGKKKRKKTSLFDHIYSMEGRPTIKISTNLNRLIRKRANEEYQPASIQLFQEEEELLSLDGRVRSRGNMRKKVCKYPPVKFDFPKPLLDSLGFLKIDKLKMVFPCGKGKKYQEKLLKEYFLYDLYGLMETHCIRAKLVDVVFLEGEKVKYQCVGFIIEDEVELARRTNATVVEKGKLRASGLDRTSFLKVMFFQYMIANTDWSVSNKHNLEMVKFPDRAKVSAIPYDFDYSGFVDQDYAVPHVSLPIKDIHDRYFFSYKVSEEEFYEMVKYFKKLKPEVFKLCEEATYMGKKCRNSNKKYLNGFFKLLDRPDKLKKIVVDKN